LFLHRKKKNKRFKTVTTELRETGNFEVLEVEDNLEVYLEKDKNRRLKQMTISMLLSQRILGIMFVYILQKKQ
jgi:curli biogenesis system outer membrane secretion channel CsgG